MLPRADLTDRESRADDFATYKVVSAGDIVVNRMRAFEGGAGISPIDGMVSGDYAVLRTRELLDPKFFHHLIRSSSLVGEMTARLRGIGNVEAGNVRTPRINIGDFGDIAVALPPLSEQRAIAKYLDAENVHLDAVIEAKRRLMMLLASRTESLISAILDPVTAAAGEVPLKALADIRFSNVDKKSVDGQVPVLLCNYTDVYKNRRITRSLEFTPATAASDQLQRFSLRRGDVLLTKDSETAEDIGVAALVADDLSGVVLGYHLALVRPLHIDADFLYWVLRSRRCRDAFTLAASGITRFGLRQDAVARIPIPNVHGGTARALAAQLEKAVGYAERALSAIAAQTLLLAEHRRALTTAAVTGQMQVPRVAV